MNNSDMLNKVLTCKTWLWAHSVFAYLNNDTQYYSFFTKSVKTDT